jgi:hypothetical protein
MKINDIYESTTAGSIATVAAPMSTQKRSNVGKGVYGNEKAGNLLTGKKTSKKYANSVNESFDTKQKVIDYFVKNGKTAGQGAAAWERGWRGKSAKKTNEPVANKPRVDYMAKYDLDEAKLDEDDLIIIPGQGRSRKSGFIPHGESRLDHEVEMARSDLFSAAKNAKQVYELIADVSEEEGLEGWVQEKIIKANDYLNTIREYLEGKQLQHEMTGGVIAGGGVGEGQVNELSSALLSRAATKAAFRQRDTAKALHDLESEPGSYFDPEMRGRPGDAHPARKFWSDKADKFAKAATDKRDLDKEKAKSDAATSQMSPAQKRQFSGK